MSHQEATSEQANILDWKSHEGKKEPFFEIEKAGRVLKVGVHLKPKEEGNIVWYLSTRTQKGKWSRFYLKLGEMEELGFLLLLLSRFCVKKKISG
jgi:hypothetical protein